MDHLNELQDHPVWLCWYHSKDELRIDSYSTEQGALRGAMAVIVESIDAVGRDDPEAAVEVLNLIQEKRYPEALAWWQALRDNRYGGDFIFIFSAAGLDCCLSYVDRVLEPERLSQHLARYAEGFDEETDEEPSYNPLEDIGQEWCPDNDCERPECHRCFPRHGCTAHEKCEEATQEGEAITLAELRAEHARNAAEGASSAE